MAIKQPIVAAIANRTWCIDEYGMDALFLLEGDESALLIDTGTGLFHIPSLVARFTDKPLTVALTHGHVDHAGGIGQFDTVYAHPDDFAGALAVTPQQRRGYADLLLSMAGGIYAPGELVTGPAPTLLPLENGHVFHLGGRDVQVYETPGHTPGGLSFLDVKERILFSGDACNPNILLALPGDTGAEPDPKCTVSAVLASALTLQRLAPRFDRHYNGHIGYADQVSVLPLPDRLIQDTIDLCRGLLSGELQGEPVPAGPFGGPRLLAKNGAMQLQYNAAQVK